MYMIQIIPQYGKEWRFLHQYFGDYYKTGSESMSETLKELAEIVEADENANDKNRYRVIDGAGHEILRMDGRKLADKETAQDYDAVIDLRR